jgi:hypothetical protein
MDDREKRLLELRQAAEALLIEKSWSDQAFRERLLRDPKLTLTQELGIEFPPGAEIEVLEETTMKKYLVLPEPATGDLSDEELESVAGGIRAADGTTSSVYPGIRRDPVGLREQILGAGSLYFFGIRR